MRDMPPIELERTPPGPPFEHRMQFFRAIIGAMHVAEDQLAHDGLSEELIAQIVGNCLAHALAFAAVNRGLPREDLAEIFLRYCGDVEAAQSNMPGARLDS